MLTYKGCLWRDMLVGRKRGTPDEIQMPSVKAEQIGMFDSTRSGSKICCNCTTKQKILRPDLLFPHQYLLHKNQNAQVVFPICISVLADPNSC